MSVSSPAAASSRKPADPLDLIKKIDQVYHLQMDENQLTIEDQNLQLKQQQNTMKINQRENANIEKELEITKDEVKHTKEALKAAQNQNAQMQAEVAETEVVLKRMMEVMKNQWESKWKIQSFDS